MVSWMDFSGGVAGGVSGGVTGGGVTGGGVTGGVTASGVTGKFATPAGTTGGAWPGKYPRGVAGVTGGVSSSANNAITFSLNVLILKGFKNMTYVSFYHRAIKVTNYNWITA